MFWCFVDSTACVSIARDVVRRRSRSPLEVRNPCSLQFCYSVAMIAVCHCSHCLGVVRGGRRLRAFDVCDAFISFLFLFFHCVLTGYSIPCCHASRIGVHRGRPPRDNLSPLQRMQFASSQDLTWRRRRRRPHLVVPLPAARLTFNRHLLHRLQLQRHPRPADRRPRRQQDQRPPGVFTYKL